MNRKGRSLNRCNVLAGCWLRKQICGLLSRSYRRWRHRIRRPSTILRLLLVRFEHRESRTDHRIHVAKRPLVFQIATIELGVMNSGSFSARIPLSALGWGNLDLSIPAQPTEQMVAAMTIVNRFLIFMDALNNLILF